MDYQGYPWLMENIIGIFILATLVEGFTEYAFGKWEKIKPYLLYVALVLGVGAAIAYKVDILARFDLHTNAYVAYVISGLIIGRGSNYLNDIISALRGTSQPTTMLNPIVNQPNVTMEVPKPDNFS